MNTAFLREIDREAEQSGDVLSILIQRLDRPTPLYSLRPDSVWVSASLIKLPILLAALEEVRRGTFRLDSMIPVRQEQILEDSEVFEYGPGEYSLEELLAWMTISSDNTATNTLIDLLGMERINGYATDVLGLKSTVLRRRMLDQAAVLRGENNSTCQTDLYRLFRLLFARKILTEELCETAIGILRRQRRTDLLLRYEYRAVDAAHKTGELSYLRHDAGVFILAEQPYYIGVSACSPLRPEGDAQLLGRIGRIVFHGLSE